MSDEAPIKITGLIWEISDAKSYKIWLFLCDEDSVSKKNLLAKLILNSFF